MGKLAIISDLHVDINQLRETELMLLVEVLQEKKITHLHLAGDTANKVEQLLEVVSLFEQNQLKTTYHFGNHEMPSLPDEAEIENYPDRHFLNQKSICLGKELVLLTFNGWYDYSFAVNKDPVKNVAVKNLYWYDRFIHRGQTDLVINQQILGKLEGNLEQLTADNQQIIVATHFVPKREFIVYQTGKYERWNELNAFLGSEQTGLLLEKYPNVQQVVFGHTHRRFADQDINGIKYSCHPFGYYFEWQLTREFVLENQLMPAFNPMKLRSLLKDHQAAFERYRLQHLKAEFLRGMTIIDYH